MFFLTPNCSIPICVLNYFVLEMRWKKKMSSFLSIQWNIWKIQLFSTVPKNQQKYCKTLKSFKWWVIEIKFRNVMTVKMDVLLWKLKKNNTFFYKIELEFPKFKLTQQTHKHTYIYIYIYMNDIQLTDSSWNANIFYLPENLLYREIASVAH